MIFIHQYVRLQNIITLQIKEMSGNIWNINKSFNCFVKGVTVKEWLPDFTQVSVICGKGWFRFCSRSTHNAHTICLVLKMNWFSFKGSHNSIYLPCWFVKIEQLICEWHIIIWQVVYNTWRSYTIPCISCATPAISCPTPCISSHTCGNFWDAWQILCNTWNILCNSLQIMVYTRHILCHYLQILWHIVRSVTTPWRPCSTPAVSWGTPGRSYISPCRFLWHIYCYINHFLQILFYTYCMLWHIGRSYISPCTFLFYIFLLYHTPHLTDIVQYL